MIITYFHLIFTFILLNYFFNISLIFLPISLIFKYLDVYITKLKIEYPKDKNVILKNNLYIKRALYFYNKNKKKEKNIIPLNVYQTYKTVELPKTMKEAHNILKKQNPEFKFHLYDDNMCREFIKKHFDKDVLFAFDNLIPGAYKADLWRYCLLYINGGIYVDIKFIIDKSCPIKFIDLINEEYLVRDISSDDKGEYIYQGFIVSKPKNIILKKCIEKLVYNVKNQIYTTSCLGITGPKLVSEICNEYIRYLDGNLVSLSVKKLDNNLNYAIFFEDKIFLTKLNPYIYQKELETNYSKLWKSKDVFKNNIKYN